MAHIEIVNTTTDIEVNFYNGTPTLVRSYSIKKRNIAAITQDVATNTLTILTNAGEKVVGGGNVRIDYASVTSPVTADLDELFDLMQTYAAAGEAAMSNDTFDNSDLVDGVTTFVLTINHGLNTENVMVVVRNPSGLSELVSSTVVDANSVTVDFGGAIVAGDWTWFVIGQV